MLQYFSTIDSAEHTPLSARNLLDPISMKPTRCPHCRHITGCSWRLLDGNVGPSLLRCGQCQAVNRSHKSEWGMLSSRERRRYWFWSVIYVLLIGGGSSAASLYIMFSQTEGEVSQTAIILALTFTIGSAVGVQAWRALMSIYRDSRGDITPMASSVLLPMTNTVFAALIPILVAAVMTTCQHFLK